MQEYVVGFMFKTYSGVTEIVLIRKNKPEWQKNKFNGVGGHIEQSLSESPITAMVREFKEETGVDTFESDWTNFVVLFGPDYILYFYYSFTSPSTILQQITDEHVAFYNLNDLPSYLIPNLRWLIPLCFDTTLDYPIMISEKSINKGN